MSIKLASTDIKILKAVRQGDNPKAFQELYTRVFGKVQLYIKNAGGDFEDAKDIFQDAVLVFYKKVRTNEYRHETEIDGFIFGVARNLWLNNLRKRKKELMMDEEFDAGENEEIHDSLFEDERKRNIEAAFAALGETCSQLLKATFYHRLSMKEVCEQMSFSTENSAKTKHYKCKQRLISMLKDNLYFKKLLTGE